MRTQPLEMGDGGKFVLLSRASDSLRNFKGNGNQNCQCDCEKQNRQHFSMVCTLIDHRNDVKMFKTFQ